MDSIEYYKVIYGGLPVKKVTYLTNQGMLYFDGKSFLVPLGNKRVPTTVEWYGIPVSHPCQQVAGMIKPLE